MTRDHLLVIDQGTTSTRAVVYNNQLKTVGQSQLEILPTYPSSGWVEHDPAAIVGSVSSQVTGALRDAGITAGRVAAIGLTNQRETTIVWERGTGRAVAPALVWQDRRTADVCDRLKVHQPGVAERTGLVIDPYFSATKIAWILDHVSSARDRADAGELAAGTVDSFLIWHLTAGRRHVTDATNASRTLLMDIRSLEWADDLCRLFGVPSGILAEIRPSAGSLDKPRASTSCRTGSRSLASRAISKRRSSVRAVSGRGKRNALTAPVPSCWPIRRAGSYRRDVV